jgi:hypothetical protein
MGWCAMGSTHAAGDAMGSTHAAGDTRGGNKTQHVLGRSGSALGRQTTRRFAHSRISSVVEDTCLPIRIVRKSAHFVRLWSKGVALMQRIRAPRMRTASTWSAVTVQPLAKPYDSSKTYSATSLSLSAYS